MIDKKSCIGCGQCATICPQKTIRLEEGRARIMPGGASGAFCCHEICPVQAIRTKRFSSFKNCEVFCMKQVTVLAPAKLNLTLDVTGLFCRAATTRWIC